MRLRKEFEDSVVASHVDHEDADPNPLDPARPSRRADPAAVEPPSRRAMSLRQPSTRAAHIQHPHLPPPVPVPAQNGLVVATARYNWTKLAGLAAACALASFGAWAATIGLARLAWKFSG